MIRFPFASVLLLSSTQLLLAAGDLGERTLWDALQTSSSQWQTAGGISATVDGGVLVLRSKEVDYGWATSSDSAPFMATATVDLEVKQCVNGQVSVQVEWLREDGSFIGAVSILKEARAGASVTGKKLSEFLPQGDKPKGFRLKFWVEGKGAEAQITKASVRFQRVWRKAETHLVKTFDAKTAFKADEGISVKAGHDLLSAALDAKTGYAAFALDGPVDFDAKGVVLLDLAKLQNGVVAVQALCWNRDGTFLKSVDLLKDVPTSGVYEVPLKALEFPADTAKLSFKVWLAGKETSAAVAGLFYGVMP